MELEALTWILAHTPESTLIELGLTGSVTARKLIDQHQRITRMIQDREEMTAHESYVGWHNNYRNHFTDSGEFYVTEGAD